MPTDFTLSFMETNGEREDGARRRLHEAPLRRLSEELAVLQASAGERSLTLREVVFRLGGRGYTLVVILLALPFITPIPLPGLSTPFGLAIALIALRLALGQRPWLPKRLQRKILPPGFLARILRVSGSLIRFLEKFLRPRLTFLTNSTGMRRLHAFTMFVGACGLLLPLPIPFSNTFPAWVVLLLACGLLERDGAFILGGYAAVLAGLVFFIFLGETVRRLL